MLSNKLVAFQADKFGESTLTQANIRVANGLLHIIDAYVPYVPNIWEYTERIAGLDSLSQYFKSQDQRVFNLLSSKQVGTNSENQPIYDSVFFESNLFLNKIAALDNEDQIFTALFPNNDAWNKSFDNWISN